MNNTRQTLNQNSQTIPRTPTGRFAPKYAHHYQYRDTAGKFVTNEYAEQNPDDVTVSKWRQPRTRD